MRKLSLLLFLVAAVATNTCFAQIAVPEINKDRFPIVATVLAKIPDGATTEGPGWVNTDPLNLRFLTPAPNKLHIWGNPGAYELKYQIFWIDLKPGKDADGNDVQIYLGHGRLDESATFQIQGITPPLPPGPLPPGPLPPLPDQDYQLMFFYDGDQLDNYPSSQRALLTSLVIREHLEREGHIIVEILEKKALDNMPERYKVFGDAVRGDPLPRIALAPKDGGKVLDYPLPENIEALDKLLVNPEIASYLKGGAK